MPSVSKVVYDNQVLIDLTGDTVTPNTLLKGATAHQMNGEKIVGTYEPSTSGSTSEDDWIDRVLTAGLTDGYTNFSDDGTIISTTDSQGRVLEKVFSDDFNVCTTTLYDPDGNQLGQTVTTISTDGSTVTTTDSKGQKLVKTFSPDLNEMSAVLTNAEDERLAKLDKTYSTDGSSITSIVEYGPATV